jgi:hypothetical protein
MKIFERPYITINYFEEESLVYTEWHGFANSEEYREVLNTYTEIAITYNVTKWIGNTKNAKAIRPKDQEWTVNEWVFDFAKSNVKRMAVIVSDDIFNKMAIENIIAKGNKIVKFDTKYFNNFAEAKKWVCEVEVLQ